MNNEYQVIEGRKRDLGGFDVCRVLPYAKKRMVGPFIFLDEMGPAHFMPGQGIDVRPHPHIGLSTLTYLFEGRILHRDSLGVTQEIIPGEVNWMTAGEGVVHSERTVEEDRVNGFKLHGIQVWIALPKQKEQITPSFHHFKKTEIPSKTINGIQIQIIAGEAFGAKSPVPVHQPLYYCFLNAPKDSNLSWTTKSNFESGIYIIDGSADCNNQNVNPNQLFVHSDNSSLNIQFKEQSRALIIGGERLSENREIYWNFVSSSPKLLENAKMKWKNQDFPKIQGEHEFIPLPD